jgi:hypothetical protein
VNTIVTNFPAVSRVRIVVNDQPVTSSAGTWTCPALPPDLPRRARRRPPPAEPSHASP